jgi:ABC-2 type transport system ATP-binding protein
LRGLAFPRTAERIRALLRLFGLDGDKEAAISGYSKGMRQKVLLIGALLHDPDLVLLDEPFSGLDVGSSLVLRRLIEELAARGKVVLFCSHELETVEKVCQRVVILHKGKVVANDSISNLRGMMAAPSLEGVFAQLAIEQDTEAISKQIADLIAA